MYEMLHRTGFMGSITKEERMHNPNVTQIEKIIVKNDDTFTFSKNSDGNSYKNFDHIPKGSTIGHDDISGAYKAEKHFIVLLPTPPEIQSKGEEVCYLTVPIKGPLYNEWVNKRYL